MRNFVAYCLFLLISLSTRLMGEDVDLKPMSTDWEGLYHGVDYKVEIRQRPSLEASKGIHVRPDNLIVYAVRVDMDAAGVGYMVTPPMKQIQGQTFGRKTSTFVEEYGVQVGINGPGYYSPANEPEFVLKDPSGLAVSGGVQYSGWGKDSDVALVFLKGEKRGRIVKKDDLPSGVEIEYAIGGWNFSGRGAMLVDRGIPRVIDDSLRVARAGLGISKDGRYLYLVVAEGGPTVGFYQKDRISTGTNLDEFAQIMAELGCYTAMNLDGSGSSAIALDSLMGGAKVLNTPSDYNNGVERAVGNHLGIYATPRFDVGVEGFSKLEAIQGKILGLKKKLTEPEVDHSSVCLAEDAKRQPSFFGDKAISWENLKKVDNKPGGVSEGGIYRDEYSGKVYVIKEGQNAANHYIGTRLLELIYGGHAPKSVLLSQKNLDKSGRKYIASEELRGFSSQDNRGLGTLNEEVVDKKKEVLLEVVIDFFEHSDRNPGNLGYITRDGKRISMTVDLDNIFEKKFTSNSLDVRRYWMLALRYGRENLFKAIDTVVDLPVSAIQKVVRDAVGDLLEYGYPVDTQKYDDAVKSLAARQEWLKGLRDYLRDDKVLLGLERIFMNEGEGLELFARANGIDLNEPLDKSGKTLLYELIAQKRFTLAKRLINSGANINSVIKLGSGEGKYESSLLKLAVEDGDIGAVKFLIENGANVNQKLYPVSLMEDVYEITKNLEIFKLLIKNGGDLTRKNYWGENAFMEEALFYYRFGYISRQNLDSIILELERLGVWDRAINGREFVESEIKLGKIEGAISLLHQGYATDPMDRARILQFIIIDHQDDLKKILQSFDFSDSLDCKIEHRYLSGERMMTPLAYAIETHNLKAVKELIDKGAKTENITSDGDSALSLSLKNFLGSDGKVILAGEDVVNFFLPYLVDSKELDVTYGYKNKPLIWSLIKEGKYDWAKKLYDKGASLLDNSGEHILDAILDDQFFMKWLGELRQVDLFKQTVQVLKLENEMKGELGSRLANRLIGDNSLGILDGGERKIFLYLMEEGLNLFTQDEKGVTIAEKAFCSNNRRYGSLLYNDTAELHLKIAESIPEGEVGVALANKLLRSVFDINFMSYWTEKQKEFIKVLIKKSNLKDIVLWDSVDHPYYRRGGLSLLEFCLLSEKNYWLFDALIEHPEIEGMLNDDKNGTLLARRVQFMKILDEDKIEEKERLLYIEKRLLERGASFKVGGSKPGEFLHDALLFSEPERVWDIRPYFNVKYYHQNHGLPLDGLNEKGQNLMDLAIECNNKLLIKFLDEKGIKATTHVE